MRRRLYRLSLYQAIIAAICFAIDYLFFHFVTDEGITLVWHSEAGKPFVTLLIGIFATLFLFSAALTALIAIFLTDKDGGEQTPKTTK
ncbi:MAG: hypothetical protein IJY69_00835 [Clostridia bacterium]|nr:hypothetical protein [Clostridia bacterium]